MTSKMWQWTSHLSVALQILKHFPISFYWRWWNSSWAVQILKDAAVKSTVLNMQANLENSAVATGPMRVEKYQ